VSNQQLAAVAKADRSVGRILGAYRNLGLLDSTLVIVSSDHGGSGRRHGPDIPLSREIPWIASGPSVRRNLDLDRQPGVVVETEDTFATACAWLGIRVPGPIKGRVVEEILEPSPHAP
jgi:arylsulfatase A-like enzyme